MLYYQMLCIATSHITDSRNRGVCWSKNSIKLGFLSKNEKVCSLNDNVLIN